MGNVDAAAEFSIRKADCELDFRDSSFEGNRRMTGHKENI
jgi:hypothetical protein